MAEKNKKVATKRDQIKALSNLSIEELKKAALEDKKSLFKLRMQKATQQLTKMHLFKLTRRHLAQIKTILTQKNSAQG